MPREVSVETLLYTIGALTVEKDSWETEAQEQRERADKASAENEELWAKLKAKEEAEALIAEGMAMQEPGSITGQLRAIANGDPHPSTPTSSKIHGPGYRGVS